MQVKILRHCVKEALGRCEDRRTAVDCAELLDVMDKQQLAVSAGGFFQLGKEYLLTVRSDDIALLL